MEETLQRIEKVWESTASMLFDGNVGKLDEYKDWLSENRAQRFERESKISGKKTTSVLPYYSDSAKWMRFDEVDFSLEYEPINFEEIDDFESLIKTLKDRLTYTGNIILGNSKFIEDSTTIDDSFYVLNSERVSCSKNIGYCSFGTYGDSNFGCFGFGGLSFSIKAFGIYKSTRLFEVSRSSFSSDCYYSHALDNCVECMFCFNIKNKKYAIGNVELSKEKYFEIKNKLLQQMREYLIREKRLPSLVELVKKGIPDYSEIKKHEITQDTDQNYDKKRIEDAFSNTTKIIFGEELKNIDDYSDWLENYTAERIDSKSCISKDKMILPGYSNFRTFPLNRLINFNETRKLENKLKIDEGDLENINFNQIGKIISKIAFFSSDWNIGIDKNNIECPINVNAIDCYKNVLNVESKSSACCYLPRESNNLFGSNEVRYSSFCINAYQSSKLTRCFEMDNCRDCSDSMFCHNSENLRDCILCFNVKNKRYAIGNVELSKEKYFEIKKIIVGEILEKLKRDKKLEINIFTLLEGV